MTGEHHISTSSSSTLHHNTQRTTLKNHLVAKQSVPEMSVGNYNNNNNINNVGQDEEEAILCKRFGNINDGTLPVITSLDDLIRELRLIFQSDNVNVEYVNYLMKSYKSTPADWKKYAKFDRYRYTRNLVDKGNDRYNLMIVCWGEGHGSAIHDHADSHCFMKMLHGSLEEVRFAWPKEGCKDEPLKEIKRTKLHLNEICYINDSLGLHRVENASNVDTAISLHLYCPPYSKCSVFNQTTGQQSKVTTTFYSIYGKRNKDNKEIDQPEDN